MIPGRTRRERRDRESGLIFGWRLPLGSNVWLLASIAIVGVLAVGLATTVRVHIGGTMRLPERRASLVLVPSNSPDWQSLRRQALEAGPFPARIELANEAAVHRILREAQTKLPPATVYEPAWREIPVTLGDREIPAMMLPPLPAPEIPPAGPPAPPPPPGVVALQGGASVTPVGAPPAGLLRSQRWLLGYDGNGRVNRVIDLSPAGERPRPSAEAWLLGATVGGGQREGGWLAVEMAP